MNKTLLILGMLLVLSSASAQDIENVMVETYYVSDANDATDTIGGHLEEGSRTYRVFLDLCADCRLRSIYGSTGHPLRISSTALFFNNQDRGRTFGHQISNSALDENTVALDSWLSLGAASNARFGIPKAQDPDGTISGPMANNDGGSAGIPGGLLQNNDASAGISLTDYDGLITDTTAVLPIGFIVQGLSPDSMLKDSTAQHLFLSEDTRIACATPGVRGHGNDNTVLVAQLTTTGELAFELNVEIEREGTVIRYVARDTLLTSGETPYGLLTWPPQCGCTDPSFIEFDPTAGCDDGSCATPIVFGCMDPAACNYSTTANFNVPGLCCYAPDSCNGLDIGLVCPTYGLSEPYLDPPSFDIYPDPVDDILTMRWNNITSGTLRAVLMDATGRICATRSWHTGAAGSSNWDLTILPPGRYVLLTMNGNNSWRSPLVKW